jgi:predicted acetyltransferase
LSVFTELPFNKKGRKMKIKLVLQETPEIIRNLFQYYIYDMSEYAKFSSNPDGTFTVDESKIQLNVYWTNQDHYPYLIVVDDEIAGFSLIRKFPFDEDYFDMGQFFILRKFKNLGIGRKAFELSVNRYPGKWITRVLPDNDGAYRFWDKVISEVSTELTVVRKELYMNKEMVFFYYRVTENVNG